MYNFQNVSIKCDLLSQALHLASIAREQGLRVEVNSGIKFDFNNGDSFFHKYGDSLHICGMWALPLITADTIHYSDFIQSAEH